MDRAHAAERSAHENDVANTHLWVALRDVVNAYDRYTAGHPGPRALLDPVIEKARTLTSRNSETSTRA